MTEPKGEHDILRHYRWDVDKTYIHTEFDSLGDLVRAYRQPPEEKVNIPGAPALLRALLSVPRDQRRVTFISGSPQQMRRTLSRKFELDGIEPDAFILKPNLSNLLKLRLKAVRHQVGYKLNALITSRVAGADEFLFGDDSEQDAWIYSLYADLLDRRVGADELQELLQRSSVYPREIEEIVRSYLNLEASPGQVRRMFIHLDRRSPVSRFIPFGWRVVPVYNYFQAAIVLLSMGVLSVDGFQGVLLGMREEGYTAQRLANSLQDLIRRGYVADDRVDELVDRIAAAEQRNASDGEDERFVAQFRDAAAAIDTPNAMKFDPTRRVPYLDLIEEGRYRPPASRFSAGRPFWDDN